MEAMTNEAFGCEHQNCSEQDSVKHLFGLTEFVQSVGLNSLNLVGWDCQDCRISDYQIERSKYLLQVTLKYGDLDSCVTQTEQVS